jgi:hypothetical protein
MNKTIITQEFDTQDVAVSFDVSINGFDSNHFNPDSLSDEPDLFSISDIKKMGL